MKLRYRLMRWLGLYNQPIRGLDATWLQNCPRCDDMTLHASVGGFAPTCTIHCYSCGYERVDTGYGHPYPCRDNIIAFQHQKHRPTPYNWHTLTEKQRWALLNQR